MPSCWPGTTRRSGSARALALVALAALGALAGARADGLALKLLSSHEGAVCNDGSPSGYWFEPAADDATAEERDRWLVHLQGGFWCWDEGSCLSRRSALTSSRGWPQQVRPGGIFNRTNPANAELGRWNHVYVGYCTSDAHSGTRPAPSPSANFSRTLDAWHFRGRAVVSAVLDDLIQDRGMGASGNATRVLFSGCSAGAQGVVVGADLARAHLERRLGAPNLSFSALMDAGWMMDSSTLIKGRATIREQVQAALVLWKPEWDRSCLEAVPDGLAWRCFFSPDAVPYIETELFMHAAQYDLFQLGWNGVAWPPANAAQKEWLAAFRAKFVSSISQVTNVFSSACHHHCSTEDASVYTIGLSGSNATLIDELNTWLGGRIAHGVDRCDGLDCSLRCPAGAGLAARP